MNDIDRWFERAARREDRTVSLYASLLTGKIVGYFVYRMRYALLLDATRYVIHVAEFLIILTSLGGLAAFTVMMLRVSSLIVSGAWWGLLEVMRERLRALAQSGDSDGIEREIGRWLALSAVAAAVVTIGGGVALVLLFPPGQDALGSLYAFLILIELALRMPVRVLHSGMFATRRIYRPLWSLFAPTAVSLVVIGIGVFVYPAGAIVIAIIASNAISIWITVHYTVRAYRLTGLWPKYGGRSIRDLLPSIPPRLGVEATLSGLGLRLDAIAVLLIAGIYSTNTRAFDLTAGYSAWRDVDVFQFFYLGAAVVPRLVRGHRGLLLRLRSPASDSGVPSVQGAVLPQAVVDDTGHHPVLLVTGHPVGAVGAARHTVQLPAGASTAVRPSQSDRRLPDPLVRRKPVPHTERDASCFPPGCLHSCGSMPIQLRTSSRSPRR